MSIDLRSLCQQVLANCFADRIQICRLCLSNSGASGRLYCFYQNSISIHNAGCFESLNLVISNTVFGNRLMHIITLICRFWDLFRLF
jgi:hypothetical protein